MNAVKLYQQGMLFGCAYRVVDQHDVTASACVDQVAQGKFSNPAKAVQSDAGHKVLSGAVQADGVKAALQGEAVKLVDRQGGKGCDAAVQV